MKVLVTGGLGFIGYKLSHLLKKQGYEVHILDKKRPSSIQKKHFKCFTFNMDDYESFKKLDRDYDYVFHLAAQSGGFYSLDNPQEDCRDNCLGTVNLVQFCKNNKPKKIILASSMAVYGNYQNASEETKENPISFYGVSKLSSEKYIKLLKEHSGIDYVVLRLFATYGAGQDLDNKHQGIVSIYLKYAIDDGCVPITGKKDRIRCLVHVDDVCSAFIMALENEKMNNEVFNVLNEEEQTPEKIINQISLTLKRNIEILEKDGYVGDQTFITGTNNKLKNVGWKPEMDLEHGIKEFVDNMEKT